VQIAEIAASAAAIVTTKKKKKKKKPQRHVKHDAGVSKRESKRES
jgi:hypothetical protein